MSDGFLSRWARRKDQVRTAEQAATSDVSAQLTEPLRAPVPSPLRGGVRGGGGSGGTVELHPAPPPPPASSPQGEGEARDPATVEASLASQAPDAPVETENPLADLPSLDTFTPETDLTPFLRTGVPSALRNAALRRMWSLDPAIRDFVSEAREYAYDWNTPGSVPGLGPLLPGDDVKAMLGRLFRDPAPEPVTAPDPEEPQAVDSPPAESEPAAPEAVVADEAPALASAEAAPAPSAAAEPAAASGERATGPQPRLRRHGGAMPA